MRKSAEGHFISDYSWISFLPTALLIYLSERSTFPRSFFLQCYSNHSLVKWTIPLAVWCSSTVSDPSRCSCRKCVSCWDHIQGWHFREGPRQMLALTQPPTCSHQVLHCRVPDQPAVCSHKMVELLHEPVLTALTAVPVHFKDWDAWVLFSFLKHVLGVRLINSQLFSLQENHRLFARRKGERQWTMVRVISAF